LPGEVQAAVLGEFDIHEDDIRVELLGPGKNLGAARGNPDLHSLSCEQTARGREEMGVVIDNQTAQSHDSKLVARSAPRIAASGTIEGCAGMSTTWGLPGRQLVGFQKSAAQADQAVEAAAGSYLLIKL